MPKTQPRSVLTARAAERLTMEAPELVPAGWRRSQVHFGGWRIGSVLTRDDLPDDCRATFSIETYPSSGDAPLEWPGRYRRLVISRRAEDRYPTWEMMRDYVRTCGLFDRSRDVFMLLPPDDRYVNIRKTAFHWWQRDDARGAAS